MRSGSSPPCSAHSSTTTTSPATMAAATARTSRSSADRSHATGQLAGQERPGGPGLSREGRSRRPVLRARGGAAAGWSRRRGRTLRRGGGHRLDGRLGRAPRRRGGLGPGPGGGSRSVRQNRVLFGGEVAEERRRRHIGGGGDLLAGCRLVALLGEEPERLGLDGGPGAFPLQFPEPARRGSAASVGLGPGRRRWSARCPIRPRPGPAAGR